MIAVILNCKPGSLSSIYFIFNAVKTTVWQIESCSPFRRKCSTISSVSELPFASAPNRVSMQKHSYVTLTHFHMKGFAGGLVLKQRRKISRKWPITIMFQFVWYYKKKRVKTLTRFSSLTALSTARLDFSWPNFSDSGMKFISFIFYAAVSLAINKAMSVQLMN